MDVDRTIAILTMIMLIFIGILTCVLQTINFSLTYGNSMLSSYIIQPDVPVSIIILLLVAMFIVPGISALIATMKRSLTTRVVHMIIISIATAGVLAVLCQDMWTLGQVGTSFTFTSSSGDVVDSTSVCVARDTRISNFILMIIGILILVVNLIYTSIVYCKTKTRETGDEEDKTED